MQHTRLDESQPGIKIAGKNMNNLIYADNTILMEENEKALKSFFMRVEEESEKKNGLKLNIQKPKIMTSGPIMLLKIEVEKVETITDFIFLSSEITASGNCSCEIQRHLFLGRKVWQT